MALDQALIATGFPYDRHEAADNNSAAFSVFLRRAQGIRRAGSAALDLSYVAAGRLDGYWEMRLQPWDIGAGILIVREAGGRVTDYAGRDGDLQLLDDRRIAASNGHVHTAILDTLREVYP
jgi:myo-inositol-1(or 4)-monophosphatase